MKTMRACVKVAQRKLEVQDVPMPVIKEADEVLIKVGAVGICGSDLSIWAFPDRNGLIMGHEFAGTVVECASGNYKAGERVLCYPDSWKPEFGADYTPGILHVPGGYAEYVIAKEYSLYRMSDEMDFVTGALLEPIGVAFKAALTADIKLGGKALVQGAGVIGTSLCTWLKAAGALVVAQTDVSDLRLGATKALTDADYLLDAKDPKIVEKLLEVSGGGFDVVIDCVHAGEATLNLGIDVLKQDGKLVYVGCTNGVDRTPIDTYKMMTKGITLCGSWAHDHRYDTVLPPVANGMVEIRKFATNIIGLDDVQKNFEELTSGKSAQTKVIIDPSL